MMLLSARSAEFWRHFAYATFIRALRTFAEVMLSCIGTNAVGLTEVDWIGAASVAGTAVISSILFAIATGLPEVDGDVPSITTGDYLG